MKKKNIVTIKRMAALCLALVMIMTNMSVFAAEENEGSETSESVSEYPTIVTYDVETQEVTYSTFQNDDSSEQQIVEEMPSSQAIIGDDGLAVVVDTTESPYRNVCYLEVTFPDGAVAHASGTLVYSNVLLTAGHAVYAASHGGWATTVSVTPAQLGSVKPFGTAYSTHISSTSGWTENGNHDWDWAVVDLNTNFSTWQNFGYYADYNQAVGRNGTTIGYPDLYANSPSMRTNTNLITAAGEYYLRGTFDTFVGMSGGPLIDTASGAVVGVISTETTDSSGHGVYNTATRITEFLFNYIQSKK